MGQPQARGPQSPDSDPQSSRDKILDVAEARFAARGFAGVGMREVAELAGLSKSSLFHHFRGKAELYLSVLDRVVERIERRVLPALDGGGDALERLERCVDQLVDALAEHPSLARLLLRTLFEDDDLPEASDAEALAVDQRLDGLIERMQQLIDEGAREGTLRPTSAPDTLQTIIGATVYHFASGDFGERLLGGPLYTAEAVRRRKHEIQTFLHRGLAASPIARHQETS